MSKIKDKINEIHVYLDELSKIAPSKFDDYKSNNLVKAACERYFEKIIEAITDIAFMIIVKRKLRVPEDDIDAFKILLENKIIDEELYKKLKQAKGMRNIISHQYGKIDDEIVFEAITEELDKDVKNFIKQTKLLINKTIKQKYDNNTINK